MVMLDYHVYSNKDNSSTYNQHNNDDNEDNVDDISNDGYYLINILPPPLHEDVITHRYDQRHHNHITTYITIDVYKYRLSDQRIAQPHS